VLKYHGRLPAAGLPNATPDRQQANSSPPGALVEHVADDHLDDHSVRLAAGASGGPLIISATLQTLLDVVDFDLGVDDAVNAARVHHQWLPDVLTVEERLPEITRSSLERRGHTLRTIPAIAAVQAVARRSENGPPPRRGLDAARAAPRRTSFQNASAAARTLCERCQLKRGAIDQFDDGRRPTPA
jgi:gamma-glutamyltranspeptidase